MFPSSPLGTKDRKGQDSLIVIELQENKPYRIKKNHHKTGGVGNSKKKDMFLHLSLTISHQAIL